MRKKVIAILLSVTMTAALLAGCGNSGSTSEPAPEQTEEPGAKVLRIGEEGGKLLLENAHVKAIEAIPITDARLQNAWKHDVYRILVEPDKENMTLRIS